MIKKTTHGNLNLMPIHHLIVNNPEVNHRKSELTGMSLSRYGEATIQKG